MGSDVSFLKEIGTIPPRERCRESLLGKLVDAYAGTREEYADECTVSQFSSPAVNLLSNSRVLLTATWHVGIGNYFPHIIRILTMYGITIRASVTHDMRVMRYRYSTYC